MNDLKISIFGDSFSDTREYDEKSRHRKSSKSWVKLLHENYNVTNYSESGTSLLWSFSKFLECGDKFDKVIFLVGSNDRIFTPTLTNEDFPLHLSPQHLLSDKLRAETSKLLSENLNKTKIWENLNFYYRHIHNDIFSNIITDLIISDLIRNKNILIIPCFRETTDKIKNTDISLIDIVNMENENWGVDWNYIRNTPKKDLRHSHMTDENNLMLYEKIQNWILTGQFNLTVTDYIRTHSKFSDYFK